MSSLRPIGSVVAELSEEFPDLTASKIRYLEDEGLLTPLRTARGSRRYADADVEQLRRILRLQRDEFLPLAVIRDRVLEAETSASSGAVDPSRVRQGRARAMSAAEVAQRGGVDPSVLKDLVAHGLVVDLDATAVEICRLVASLAEFGIEPRHLRAFRAAADREVGLVQQAMAPRRAQLPVIEQRQLTAQLFAHLLDLHVALVRQRSSSLDS
jgi:DNA-binding transcriptional MerR regulator